MHINEDEEKYRSNYLSIDHIRIRLTKNIKSVDKRNFPYLKMKNEFGPNKISNSYQMPKIQKLGIPNRSSV